MTSFIKENSKKYSISLKSHSNSTTFAQQHLGHVMFCSSSSSSSSSSSKQITCFTAVWCSSSPSAVRGCSRKDLRTYVAQVRPARENIFCARDMYT